MQRQAGFTLLELMVAVTVFIILAALAIPSFTTYLDKARLRGAADDAVTAIANARQNAVKFDRNVTLETKVNGTAWCLGAREAAVPTPGEQAAAATTCDCSTAAGAALCTVDGVPSIVDSSAHAGVTLASAASTLTFDGRLGIRNDASVGNANASGFDLTSKSGTYTITVNVSPLGQATVCSKSGNILGYPAC
jgi:type IV fimbrial biogenesis protein FimT